MPVEVPCPGCGLRLKAPDNMVGKKAKCKKCETQFRIPGVNATPGDSVGDGQMLSVISMPSPFGAAGTAAPAAAPVATAVAPPPAAPKPVAPAQPSVGSPTPAARPGFGASKPALPGLPTAPPVPQAVPAAAVPAGIPVAKALPAEPVPQAAPADPFAFDSGNGAEAKPKGKKRDDEDDDDRPRAKKRDRDDDDDDDRPRKKRRDDDEDDDDRPRAKKKRDDDEDDRPRKSRRDDDDDDDRPRAKKKRDDDDDDDDRPRKKRRDDDDEDDDDRPRSRRRDRDDDDDDDRPRKKRRDDDEDDDRPRKKRDDAPPAAAPATNAFDFDAPASAAKKVEDSGAPLVTGGDPFAFDAGPAAPAADTKAKKRDRDDEDDDRPRKKRRDDDEDDDRPRSKKKRDDEDDDDRPRGKKGRDRDDEPAPPPPAAPVAPPSGVLFSFGVGPADLKTETKEKDTKGKKRDDEDDDRPKSKKKGRDEDDDRGGKKDRKKGGDDENDGEEKKYVRPGEQKGGKKPLLMVVLLGVGALGLLIAAVVVMQKQAKEQAAADAAAKAKKDAETKKEEPPPDPAPKDPGKNPGKKDPGGKKDPSPKEKENPKEPPEPPVAMLDLPDIRKVPVPPFQVLKGAEGSIAPKGPPILVEAPLAKIKRVFAPEKRNEQDVIVVWQAVAPVNNKGEKLYADIHSGQSGARVGRLEFDGDGKEVKCDVSPDGKSFVAASPDGKLTVWNLGDSARPKTLENYDPYTAATESEHKNAGLAAVFFNKAGQPVTVTTAGAIQIVDPAGKKFVEKWSPLGIKAVPGKVALGKNVATDHDRTSVVIAIGGFVYQLDTAALRTVWKLDLKGDVGRHLGLAVVGSPGRIAYAFETNVTGKKERAALLCMPNTDTPTLFRWPVDQAGDPAEAAWAGPNLAAFTGDKGVVFVTADGGKFKPVVLTETGGRFTGAANENGYWYAAPDAGNAGNTLIQQISPDDVGDLARQVPANKPALMKLTDKGIK